jgi:hypothetical protein
LTIDPLVFIRICSYLIITNDLFVLFLAHG